MARFTFPNTAGEKSCVEGASAKLLQGMSENPDQGFAGT